MSTAHRYLLPLFCLTTVWATAHTHLVPASGRQQSCEFLSHLPDVNAALEALREALPPVQTLSDLIQASVNRRESMGGRVLPSSTDYEQLLQAVPTWAPERVPGMIAEFLPQGSGAMPGSLRDANELGMVKTDLLTSLRVEFSFNGKKTGTNVGVNLEALRDNIHRPNKSLIRKGAKAAILWLHGGGTGTTGHHTAGLLMAYLASLGVEVIPIDVGGHGWGPRENFRNVKEYLEWVRAFTRSYLKPAGVPLVLAGHSLGGELVHQYRTLFPKSEEGDVFDGTIVLSPVLDYAPGGTPREKMLASRAHWNKIATREGVHADDLALHRGLYTAGKLSPLGFLFEGMISTSNDWRPPAHGGNDLLPSMCAMGAGDFLLVGAEDIFNRYQKSLNPELHETRLYSEGIPLGAKATADGKPRTRPVGHLIQDHYGLDNTDTPQLFLDIKGFLERKIIKQPLPRLLDVETNKRHEAALRELAQKIVEGSLDISGLKMETDLRAGIFGIKIPINGVHGLDDVRNVARTIDDPDNLMISIATEWMGNLAFREWATSAEFLSYRPVPGFDRAALSAKVTKDMESVDVYIKSASPIVKSIREKEKALPGKKNQWEAAREAYQTILAQADNAENQNSPAYQHALESRQQAEHQFRNQYALVEGQIIKLRADLVRLNESAPLDPDTGVRLDLEKALTLKARKFAEVKGLFIPEGPAGERGRQIQELLKVAILRRSKALEGATKHRFAMAEKQAQLKTIQRITGEALAYFSSERVQAQQARLDAIYAEMVELNDRIENAIGHFWVEHYARLETNPDAAVEYPQSLLDLMKTWAAPVEQYQKEEVILAQVVAAELESGALTLNEAVISKLFYGTAFDHYLNQDQWAHLEGVLKQWNESFGLGLDIAAVLSRDFAGEKAKHALELRRDALGRDAANEKERAELNEAIQRAEERLQEVNAATMQARATTIQRLRVELLPALQAKLNEKRVLEQESAFHQSQALTAQRDYLQADADALLLELRLYQSYPSPYYEYRVHKLADILEQVPFVKWREYAEPLQKMWGKWRTIWAERQKTSTVSAY